MMQLSLQKAIEEAKKNPTSEFAKQLRSSIESGELDQSAQKQGVDLTKFGRPPVQQKRNVAEKIADFIGGKEIAQGLGQALAGNVKRVEETQNQQIAIQGQLLQRIKEKKARGEDTSRLEGALEDLGVDIKAFGEGAEEILNPNQLTNKQVIGDALQLATTAGGAKVAGAVAGEATTAVTAGQGLAQGAKTGLLGGMATGALTGTAQGLQENKDAKGIAKDALTGTAIGGAGGAVLGGLIGAIGGGLTGSKLRQQALNRQRELGIKPAQDIEALKSKAKIQGFGDADIDFTSSMKPVDKAIGRKQIALAEKALKDKRSLERPIDLVGKNFVTKAKIQGFGDADIDFTSSMKPVDKAIGRKQIALAEKALKDKRSLERPIDLVGKNFVTKAKKIEALNKEFGKNVDEVAKTLKGKQVDVSGMRDSVIKKLESVNVSISANGKLDFSQSVFKNIPQIQKELQKVISTIPDGSDAYQVHIFKKTLDEMVDYGVAGEGLKGNAKQILKALRSYADDALDTTFADYNKVNTDFRATKQVIDNAKDLFGKKNGFSKERGGGLLRAIFSNRESRGRLLAMLDELETVGKQYEVGTKDNLVDQALFTEMIEDVYGTQATTSLQGQVRRAVQGTQKVLRGIRNPIEGAGELLASGVESVLGISDENKRKILLELLR